MRLSEVFGKDMTNEAFLEACEQHSKIYSKPLGQVLNLGAHDYNTVKGTFKFSNHVLRVDREGVFTMNGKVIDVNRIPQKKGRVYLVSKICAAYARRPDFVFVNEGLRSGQNRYLFAME